jgi:RsiW-degrading membrane proteinase PrsW (M82 family)
MRLKTRIHEWLARNVSWIQYPNVTLLPERRRFSLRNLTWKQSWWVAFALFWGSLTLLSVYGNSI